MPRTNGARGVALKLVDKMYVESPKPPRRYKVKSVTDESGASLRALGLKPGVARRAEEWDRPSRRRVRRGGHQLVPKIAWTLFDERSEAAR